MVVLKTNYARIKPTYLDGPADIVVEIVSPGSDSVDHGDKLVEYESAGVPEYWLIDHRRKDTLIYVLDPEGRYRRLDPDDKGRLVSSLLPGFALDPAILWRDDLPEGPALIELVQAMVK
jgi:Uma2 family endonuclease